MSQTLTGLANVSARIAAEFILGKIRLTQQSGEPPYLFKIREIVKRIEKAVGRENLESAGPEIREIFHALGDALFDEVTKLKTPETTLRLANLQVHQRIMVETVVNNATGKTHRDKRWDDDLHAARKALDQVVALSISGIEMHEIREGYDQMLHAVIDHVCDNWRTLVD